MQFSHKMNKNDNNNNFNLHPYWQLSSLFRPILKLRGRKEKFVEISEDLNSHPSDILIAFGGYLGLYAGYSALDFIKYIINKMFNMKNLGWCAMS